ETHERKREPREDAAGDERAKHDGRPTQQRATPPANAAEHQQKEKQGNSTSFERHLDKDALGEIEEDSIALRLRKARRQRGCERQRFVTHVLQASRIEAGEIVAGAVI